MSERANGIHSSPSGLGPWPIGRVSVAPTVAKLARVANRAPCAHLLENSSLMNAVLLPSFDAVTRGECCACPSGRPLRKCRAHRRAISGACLQRRAGPPRQLLPQRLTTTMSPISSRRSDWAHNLVKFGFVKVCDVMHSWLFRLKLLLYVVRGGLGRLSSRRRARSDGNSSPLRGVQSFADLEDLDAQVSSGLVAVTLQGAMTIEATVYQQIAGERRSQRPTSGAAATNSNGVADGGREVGAGPASSNSTAPPVTLSIQIDKYYPHKPPMITCLSIGDGGPRMLFPDPGSIAAAMAAHGFQFRHHHHQQLKSSTRPLHQFQPGTRLQLDINSMAPPQSSAHSLSPTAFSASSIGGLASGAWQHQATSPRPLAASPGGGTASSGAASSSSSSAQQQHSGRKRPNSDLSSPTAGSGSGGSSSNTGARNGGVTRAMAADIAIVASDPSASGRGTGGGGASGAGGGGISGLAHLRTPAGRSSRNRHRHRSAGAGGDVGIGTGIVAGGSMDTQVDGAILQQAMMPHRVPGLPTASTPRSSYPTISSTRAEGGRTRARFTGPNGVPGTSGGSFGGLTAMTMTMEGSAGAGAAEADASDSDDDDGEDEEEDGTGDDDEDSDDGDLCSSRDGQSDEGDRGFGCTPQDTSLDGEASRAGSTAGAAYGAGFEPSSFHHHQQYHFAGTGGGGIVPIPPAPHGVDSQPQAVDRTDGGDDDAMEDIDVLSHAFSTISNTVMRNNSIGISDGNGRVSGPRRHPNGPSDAASDYPHHHQLTGPGLPHHPVALPPSSSASSASASRFTWPPSAFTGGGVGVGIGGTGTGTAGGSTVDGAASSTGHRRSDSDAATALLPGSASRDGYGPRASSSSSGHGNGGGAQGTGEGGGAAVLLSSASSAGPAGGGEHEDARTGVGRYLHHHGGHAARDTYGVVEMEQAAPGPPASTVQIQPGRQLLLPLLHPSQWNPTRCLRDVIDGVRDAMHMGASTNSAVGTAIDGSGAMAVPAPGSAAAGNGPVVEDDSDML